MKHPSHFQHSSESGGYPSANASMQSERADRPKRSFWQRVWHVLGMLTMASLVVTASVGGVVGGILYSFYTELPSISRLEEFRPSLVTKVYDSQNEMIGEFFIEKRALVRFEDLPEAFLNALIAVEDKRFYQHFGIDPIGFGRAVIENIKARAFAQGASTLTQQLTRGLFLSPEKKIVRKIKEWMLAIQIEQKYRSLEKSRRKAKERILELYANQFYWGHGAYGVQAAAKLYFGKDVTELDLGECAMLAGLIQLPAVYSPLTHPERAKKRQAHVLNRMIAEGYIIEGEFQITERTLAELEARDVPEEVVAQVAALQGRRYPDQSALTEELDELLAPEQQDEYRSLILQHATEPSFKLSLHGLNRLKAGQLPDDVAQKLADFPTFPHLSKQEFIKRLENILGQDLAAQHQSIILAQAEHEVAQKARVTPFKKKRVPEHQIDKAPYFVEHVRQYLEERYGRAVYQDGLEVYTTLDLELQNLAKDALQKGLRDVQKRHGFKLAYRDTPAQELEERLQFIERYEWKKPLEKGRLVHAIVTEVTANRIQVKIKNYVGTIEKDGFKWAGSDAAKLVQQDDLVLVKVQDVNEEEQTLRARLDMEPLLEGAFVAIDPQTGYILAMVGGYDFYRSKFNRAVQALRQPGSSFKPFVYLTALERGFTPASVIVDEPVTFVIDEQTGQTWSPQNYSGTHKGPMTLRQALESSTNVIAAKLIDQVGPRAVIDTARRLGISSYLNPYPSLALGGSEVYLYEMVSAYSTFANKGFRVEPIFVTKVLDREGNVLEENVPRARQVLAEDTTYLLVSMMQGVVQRGTAARASSLGRPLAGKTGTTNDNTDALFIGYSPSIAAGAWVGYDENRKSIGYKETGGRAALPIWMAFMEKALEETPIEEFPVPPGVSFVDIDPETGLLAAPQCGGSFTEVFKKGTEPREYCYQAQHYSSAR